MGVTRWLLVISIRIWSQLYAQKLEGVRVFVDSRSRVSMVVYGQGFNKLANSA